MKRIAVLLPAAGNSTRFGGRVKKPFLTLGGQPLWQRTLALFATRPDVASVTLLMPPETWAEFRAEHGLRLEFHYGNVHIHPGGATRTESVANGLATLDPDAEFVAVHDCARPLTPGDLIDRIFARAIMTGAAIPGLPVADTLKRVSVTGTIEATVSRTNLWGVQTPQTFRRDWLQAAYTARSESSDTPTDDAQLVEALGHPVEVVPGDARNFKVTTPADLAFAETLLGVSSLPERPRFHRDEEAE